MNSFDDGAVNQRECRGLGIIRRDFFIMRGCEKHVRQGGTWMKKDKWMKAFGLSVAILSIMALFGCSSDEVEEVEDEGMVEEVQIEDAEEAVEADDVTEEADIREDEDATNEEDADDSGEEVEQADNPNETVSREAETEDAHDTEDANDESEE